MTCGGDLRQPPPEEPTTPEERQLVVDAAAGFRCIAECRMYGLMKGGPEINVQNCVHFMARGAELGYHPTLPPHQLALAMISVDSRRVALFPAAHDLRLCPPGLVTSLRPEVP